MPHSPIPGIKVLGFGDYGSGKTTLIKSLIQCGITPMCIFTEPGQEMVADTPVDKLHWMYVRPLNPDLKTLMEASKRVGQMNPDQLQKANDMNRDKDNQFYPILNSLAKFTCARTGENFGNVSSWGTDKCLVMDSLSGLTIAAEKNTVGEKYAKTQPEFQIAMKLIENLVNQLAVGFYCHVYLTAHPEREMDEVNQAIRIYPSTLGRKLAPLLGRNFSDVIYTEMWMDGAIPKWGMSTVHAQAAVKTRNWPHAARQPLSFVPAIETWKKRGGIISPELPPLEAS